MTSFSRFKSGFHLPYRFEIVVGSRTVDLIHGSNNIYMESWRPAVPDYKDGGTFQSTPLVDGRQLVDKKFENVEETIDFYIDANDPDMAIHSSQQLRRAFEECSDYWVNQYNDTIGYLLVQNAKESNIRYAAVVKGRMPEDEYPFGQMVQQPNGRALWAGLACSIEHLPWQATIPGTGEGVEIGIESCYNRVVNGSFESWSAGSPVSWTAVTTPTLTENLDINFIRSGHGSMLIAKTAGSAAVRQEITLLWPGTVTLTCWVWLVSGTATLRINITGAGTLIDSDSTTVTGEWVQLSVTGTITNVGIRLILAIDTGSAYIDDVEFNICFGNLDNNGVLDPTTNENEVFVINKHNIAQLTHVYMFDGSTYTDNLVSASSGPLNGLVDGSFIVFGIDSTVENSGPFNNLVFDISTVLSSTSAVTGTWEYWSGATWTAFTAANLQDNTDNGNNPFTVLGVNSVHWLTPSNWAAVDLSSAVPGAPAITGFWVRMVLSGIFGTVTPAEQISRPIYTVVWPYIEILDENTGGDIDSLIQIVLNNRSDDTANLLLARSDVVICGLRKVSRGNEFTPYINIGDEQNTPGITIGSGVGTIATNVQAPSGRVTTYTPASANNAVAVVQNINIDSVLAPQYFGRYRAFVRVDDASGSGFPMSLRLTINDAIRYQTPYVDTTGSGGTAVDVGEFVIDPGSITARELPALVIGVLTKHVATTQLVVFDVILIPVDEWVSVTTIRQQLDQRQMFIDSLTNPKHLIRAKSVDTVTTNSLVDSKIPLANGPAVIHKDGIQRLWFFFTNNQAIELSFAVSNTVQINAAKRYLSARGQ